MYIKYQIYKKQVSENGMDWNDTDEKRKGSILGIYETLAACEGEDPDTPYPDNPNDPDYGKPYSDRYFTIEFLEDSGYIYFEPNPQYGLIDKAYYSLNSGTWVSDLSGRVYKKGDVIRMKILSDSGYYGREAYPVFSRTKNTKFRLYGNINSMYHGDDFKTDLTVYNNMFNHWFTNSSVVDVSKIVIPYETAGQQMCYNMFYNCTSLETAPELPAMTLGRSCYSNMFYGCKALTKAPELTATQLADYCYDGMFNGCSALTKAPSILPATTLAYTCYQSMFQGCSSLKTAPELPATTLGGVCYKYMFYNCTSLETAPELPATTLTDNCYEYMFYGCKALTKAPSILPAMSVVGNSCYQNMFRGCSSLKTAPELPATELHTNCYYAMFNGCSALEKAPELPATTLAESCYNSMFNGCSALKEAPALPATTLTRRCYEYMFRDCTSLTKAPELPAKELVYYCYNTMFAGCSSLNYIKCMAETFGTNYCYYWVEGVSPTGTFVKKKGVNWSRGDSSIPANWNVEEVD